MKDALVKLFTDFNALMIRISRGTVGTQLGTQSILILHTTGRKSGESHSTPNFCAAASLRAKSS